MRENINSIMQIDLDTVSAEDLRIHFFTGRDESYGRGRTKVTAYRTGVQTNLGDIEISVWIDAAKAAIHRNGFNNRLTRLAEIRGIPNGPGQSCPLLKDGRCSVHDCKPTVCALYPLGRAVAGKIPKNGLVPGEEMVVHYILNDISCGSANRVNTVRSWLARFGIPEEDEFYLLWNKVIIEQGQLIRKLEEHNVSSRLLNLFWNIQFHLLYANYDTTQDFMPQFQRAAEELSKLGAVVLEVEKTACSYDTVLKMMMEETEHEA